MGDEPPSRSCIGQRGFADTAFDKELRALLDAYIAAAGIDAPPERPGLYAVGLRWLHSEPSSGFVGIGADAEHIVNHMEERCDAAPAWRRS